MPVTRSQTKHDPGEPLEVCSVSVGNRIYGIPIRHILEIVGGACPQSVPLAPEFVGGLVHYRGDVLTSVSLRRILGLPPHPGAQDLLVIESGNDTFGLLVDVVREVLAVSASDFEANPSTLSKERQTVFAGAYKLAQGLMVMLDPERLEPMRLAAAS